LNWDEYVTGVKDTMIYPTHKETLACITLGLIEEFYESEDVCMQYDLRMGSDNEDLISELGDLLYYTAALCDYWDYVPNVVGKLFFAEKHIPMLAKCINKVIRDDNYEMVNPKRIEEYHTVMDALYSYIVEECILLCIPISEVMIKNREKLLKRKESGTIKGDGDKR
jgi:hypothetical protein